MDCCPLEIWTEIFETACTDNEFTGRSLSAVSRFIRRASAPVKYQSICISNSRQLKAFSGLLNSDFWSPLQPVRMLLIILEASKLPRFQEVCDAYMSIMNHVANQLHIFCLHNSKALLVPRFLRQCIHFPHLKSLYINCDFAHTLYAISEDPMGEHGSSPSFPRLRYSKLRLGKLTYDELFSTLINAAPALDYLEVNQSGTVQVSDLLRALEIYYEISTSQLKGNSSSARSPPTLPSIVLQLMTRPSTSLSWLHDKFALEQLATRDGRLRSSSISHHHPPVHSRLPG